MFSLRLPFALVLLLSVPLTACGGEDDNEPAPKLPPADPGPQLECIDNDVDGYGKNCDAGPDCDDYDYDIQTGCEEPVEDTCMDGETKSCKINIGNHNGVLSCIVGQQQCLGTEWGPCEGEIEGL